MRGSPVPLKTRRSTAPVNGCAHPLGATLTHDGANFSVYSKTATRLELLFFDRADDARPSRVVPIDPSTNRTYHYWHAFVPGVEAGQIYALRAYGPFDPSRGLRFDPSKLLLDPYGRAVAVPKGYSREAACFDGDNTATAIKSVVTDPHGYNWEGDAPLRRPWSRTIIYEMHVRGFTAHPSSGLPEPKRGTYAGLVEKIPYLQRLGITVVELLPVFQFDPNDAPAGRTNYWGYAPVSFFAPHHAYSSRRDPLGAVDEFRDMVKALHRAGIEVILDVVFNHTGEGGERGPTQCFRGLDNPTYYLLSEDRSHYANFTGTGNTLNANHPVIRRMILDSLRYWVNEMHVDGFRFDLAAILSRDSSGAVMPNPPVLWDIESDPALAGTKMIAEAWDAAGLYQVGNFVGDNWKEWNDRFRDDIRDFFRGANGCVGLAADRLLGSPSIYGPREREVEESINFASCHDGFTINDLVSYNYKHNEGNGENNHDGSGENRSWNCGIEGPTDDPVIEKLRAQQVKNFLAAVMLSVGVPMFVMGDEVRRSQGGNNNAYCQDNEMSWFDWSLVSKHPDIFRFVRLLIERRLIRDVDYERRRVPLIQVLREQNPAWHGVKLNQPDWSYFSHTLAIHGELKSEQIQVHIILNAYWEPLDFELPILSDLTDRWWRWVDTALDPPDDICEWSEEKPVFGGTYRAGPRSLVVLIAGNGRLARMSLNSNGAAHS
jgi:glycogen operon protein